MSARRHLEGIRSAVAVLLGVAFLLTAAVLPEPTVPNPTAPRAGPVPRADVGVASGAYSTSQIFYSSSVDGFNLSYYETLPAGYNQSRTYPLAVELHGLDNLQVTPLSGGYLYPPVATTAAAASANGFILIDLNTRTGAGWYVDSPYTGPQQQDVLDAITHERGLRHIGSVDLFGTSMGSIGALSIALHHPSQFAGVGGVASFTDYYQFFAWSEAINDSALVTAMLLPTGGAYPNGSALARGIFNELSPLRFHPQNASHLRVYLANGGQDSLSTDSPFWPYQQGNDTILDRSCFVSAALYEPANCTQPLTVLHDLDPANYSYRYIFEPNGPHSYYLLNATDMFRFFLGEAPNGTYDGTYPVPIPEAPSPPLVTLIAQPTACGGVTLSGVPFSTDMSYPMTPGFYPIRAIACPGLGDVNLSTVGAVAYTSSNGTLRVVGSGAFIVRYRPLYPAEYPVQIAASYPCDAVGLNGSFPGSGSTLRLAAGIYPIQAGGCGAHEFSRWIVSSNLSVANATSAISLLTVDGGGRLLANYSEVLPLAVVPVSIGIDPPFCGPVMLAGIYESNGTEVYLPPGPYAAVAPACPGATFGGWSTAGAITLIGTGAEVTVRVTGGASLVAVYSPLLPPWFEVAIEGGPVGCAYPVVLDGAGLPSGGTVLVTPGFHSLSAGVCAGFVFSGFSAFGGASLASGEIEVSDNATLQLHFLPDPAAGSTIPGGPPASAAGPSTVSMETELLAAIGVAGAIGGGVGWLIGRKPRHPR